MKSIILLLITVVGISCVVCCLYVGFIGIFIAIYYNELLAFISAVVFLTAGVGVAFLLVKTFDYVNNNI